MRSFPRLALVIATWALCSPASAARAESVRVLAAGAVQGALQRLQPMFTAAAGHKLETTFDTVGALRDRVLAGERADVLILSVQGMDAVAKAGRTDGARIDLGSISVALAVRKGSAVPDVTSADGLRRALLAAGSIAHADPARGATAGTHFAAVLQRLGIADQVASRVSVLPFGGEVVEAVAQGRIEIGVSQSSEIVVHPGVTLAGGLPEPFAHRTRYVAAKLMGAGAAGEALIRFLQGPEGRAAFAATGFELP